MSLKRIYLCIAGLLVFASLSTSCKPEEIEPILKVDKTSIIADGNEAVTFTVMYDGADVTNTAIITNTTKGTIVENATFSTKIMGEYTFSAVYNGKVTNSVVVTVEALPEVIISVDKTEMVADGVDKVVFTVTYQDNDVTGQAIITNTVTKEDLPAGTTEFTTTEWGDVAFRAKYNGMNSNTVSVHVNNAPANPLVLEVDKSRINADGTDQATFTVTYDGENVTSQAQIKNMSTGQAISGNTFTYNGTEPVLNFVAEYDGKTSDPINIGFGDFYKNVFLIRYTGTWCDPCTRFSVSLNEAIVNYPDRLIQSLVHSYAERGDPYVSTDYSLVYSYLRSHGSSVPASYFDFKTLHVGTASTSQITSFIKNAEILGARCGIAATASFKGTEGTVEVKVTASTAGQYYLGVMLVEDGIEGSQANHQGTYIHNDTFRKLISQTVTGDDLGTIAVNATAEKSYDFSIKQLDGYNVNKCRLIFYVAYKDGNDYIVTNAATCSIDGKVDYRFELE